MQLSRDEIANHPEAAEIILCDSYMDDILCGAQTVELARKLRQDLKKVMLKDAFMMRKWCIPVEDQETLVSIQDSSANQAIMALGLFWDPKKDLFLFRTLVESVEDNKQVTKRSVLSQIAKFFDPLGLLALKLK